MAVARGTWSVEKVVADLRRLHASGEPINRVTLLDRGHSTLVAAAERYCGSFGRAVKLAGVAIQPPRPVWTAKRVVEEIRRLHRAGQPLSCEQLKAGEHGGLVSAATKYIGSWRAAIAKAGVPRFKRGRWKSWDEVRTELLAAHARGIKMSTSAMRDHDLAGLVDAAKLEAGSWNRALERAGIPIVMSYERWSRDDVIAGIRRLHADGVALSSNVAIARGHRKLVKAATRHFKTWRSACYVAIPDYKPLLVAWDESRVRLRIQRRYRDSLSVRSTDVAKQEPSLTEAAHRLGLAWRATCLAAGVPAAAIAPRIVTKRTRWTEASLADALRQAARAGTPLLVNNFRGSFVQAVQRRFDSWAGAMAAAGLSRQYARDHATAMANRLGGEFLRGNRRRKPRRRQTTRQHRRR